MPRTICHLHGIRPSTYLQSRTAFAKTSATVQPCPGCPGRHHTGVLQQPYTGPPVLVHLCVNVCVCVHMTCASRFCLHPSVCVQEHKLACGSYRRKSPFCFVFALCSAGMGLAQPGTCPWAAVSWCLWRPSQCLVCRAGARGLCGGSSGLAQGGICWFCRQSACSSVPGTFPVGCDAWVGLSPCLLALKSPGCTFNRCSKL